MAMGKHYGSFAKGFSDSLIAMMRMSMMMEYYKSREDYMRHHQDYWDAMARSKGMGKGMDPGTRAAYWAGGEGYGSGVGGGQSGGDPEIRQHIIDKSLELGKDPNEALAMWRQESGYGTNNIGDAGSSFGDFQFHFGGMNPKMPHSGMGDDFLKATGIDVRKPMTHDERLKAIDFALDRAANKGWGDWATTRDKLRLANSWSSASDQQKKEYASKAKPTETVKAEAKPDTPVPAKTAPVSAPEKTPDTGVDVKTPYHVAGDAGAVSEAGAERAAADLARHRASSGDDTDTFTHGALDPAQARTYAKQQALPLRPDDPVQTGPVDYSMELARGPHTALGRGLPPPYDNPPIQPHDIATTNLDPNTTPYAPAVSPARTRPPDSRPDQGGGYPAPDVPRTAEINAPVVGGDERLRPAANPAVNPDVPAPAAQNVSSPAGGPAIPVTPQSNSRFTQVTAPNSDPMARSRPQMTALDLSHLWGPNPPLSQRGGGGAAPQPGPDLAQRVPLANTPMPPPRPDDLGSDVATASRKGGPMQRFERGGIPSRPALRFAGGGGAPDTFGAPYTGTGTNAPQFTAADINARQNVTNQMQQAIPITGATTFQDISNAYNAMTPAQQKWYTDAASAIRTANQYPGMGSVIYNQLGAYPTNAAPAATPAPAATLVPASVVAPSSQTIVQPQTDITTTDPTSTTTTGTPGVPNIVTANTYDPNKIGTTGSGSPTDSTGGTNYAVGEDDTTKQILSRKGGPIGRYAGGGAIPSQPTMKFAAGGQSPGMAYAMSPNYIGPTMTGGWAGSTPYSALAPNQQAWADTTRGLLSQIHAGGAQDAAYWGGGGQSMTGPVDTSQWANQITPMPDAIWPTAAPAAPTPVYQPPPSVQNITTPQTDISTTDPTSTTTTGTLGVPNIAKAKSYDPNVDAATGAGFANTSNVGGTNYNVGSNDLLQTTGDNTISGSRRGGPITPRVNRYDDGGGVSPSIAGMPPGLSQQGAAPIPPIYYNPATYSAAGAPVGKGVSATSAPTYGAGAIPSLPMARGGVVRFQDGGDVGGADDTAMMQSASMDDMMDRQFDAEDQGAARTESAGAPQYITPADFAAPAQGQGAQGSAMSPAQQIMPQVKDDQGNPSRGLIAAIGDGLHWLGDHLGLIGSAQAHPAIAGDPNTQTNRANFANGQNVGGLTKSAWDDAGDLQDPAHQLNEGERNIARMEGAYKYLLSQGRDKEAAQMAASMLQYSVTLSQNYSEQAAKELYDGNLQGAVDNINNASDAIPDGRVVHAALNKDGTVTVTGSDLNGRVLWQKQGAAQAILEHATALGRSGKLQWNALESQAAKYDSTFADMQKNRRANAVAGAKERADAQAQQQANDQIAKLGPVFGDPVQPASTPAIPPQPGKDQAAPVVAAAAEPGSSADSTSTAAPRSPPPTADKGPTGHGGALPAAPQPADLPASGAQDVDFTHSVAYQSIPTNTRPNYFTTDGRPIVGGRPMLPPPTMDEVTLKSYAPQVQAAYRERWQQYQAQAAANERAYQQDVDSQRRDLAADITSRRAAQTQAHSDAAREQTQEHADTAAAARMREQEKLQQSGAKLTEERTEKFEREKWAHEQFKTVPPAGYLAGSSFTAAPPKSDGTPDDVTSAKNLGKMFDLDDRGGIRRVQALSNALYNTRSNVSVEQLGDTIVGMANGQYGYRSKVGDDGLREVQVFPGPKVGDGEPVTIKMSPADYTRVDQIKGEFVARAPKPAAPAAPASPAAPAPAIPRTPFKPLVQSRPGEESGIRKPQWVPPEQVPPEQRQLYPELNQ